MPVMPNILFMDNHESHLTIDALNFYKDNGINVLTFPPHTTDKLQPLDKCVFKSLKSFFSSESYNWLLCNLGKTISIYEVSMLFGKSYERAFSMNNIISGLNSTGIWPFD